MLKLIIAWESKEKVIHDRINSLNNDIGKMDVKNESTPVPPIQPKYNFEPSTSSYVDKGRWHNKVPKDSDFEKFTGSQDNHHDFIEKTDMMIEQYG